MTLKARMLSARTTTGAGDVAEVDSGPKTIQGVVNGTGAVTATVEIDGSNNGVNWDLLGTLSLSGTTTASDSFSSMDRYRYLRADVTAISGTGAAVTVEVAV
jgi:hypothetical protein